MTPDQEQEAIALMVRAQRGDTQAYAALLVLCTSAIKRLVRQRWGDVSWVDDAVQETLMSIHRARHTYDPLRPFAPWLYAIGQKRIIDVARREMRIAQREHGVDDLPERAAAVERPVDGERIRAALASLPVRQREVIVAMKFADASVREVGRQLGMSESAVKVTAHRGYKALRRLLGGNDVE